MECIITLAAVFPVYWHVSLWHGAAERKRSSSEWMYLEAAGFVHRHALLLMHTDIELYGLLLVLCSEVAWWCDVLVKGLVFDCSIAVWKHQAGFCRSVIEPVIFNSEQGVVGLCGRERQVRSTTNSLKLYLTAGLKLLKWRLSLPCGPFRSLEDHLPATTLWVRASYLCYSYGLVGILFRGNVPASLEQDFYMPYTRSCASQPAVSKCWRVKVIIVNGSANIGSRVIWHCNVKKFRFKRLF